ncbi:hypothetical protein [Marinobacter mobilis]|uniref:PilZ domain-containing protein n=1 Tax=Marinobacter mobilis TaxID=488533 RepID=A0A1H2VDW3_9GAMM|nr:hypothetical protein [Marinobacter mobilis]SDW66420.1 hypothetical protein SAMN04487960_103417 [Marinobacter mobilis]
MNEAIPDLIACFQIRHGLFKKEVVEAQLFDLNQFGCVLKTDKVFNPGDTLQLELVMDMPIENIRAKGVSGLVTERRKHCSNFFYSIDFIKNDDGPSSTICDQLKRIRDIVRKKQSLRSRRSSGPSSSIRQLA